MTERKQWAAVGRHFHPPKSMTNLSFHMKRLYERLLLPYERVGARRAGPPSMLLPRCLLRAAVPALGAG